MSNKDIETNINENTEKSETPKKKNIVHVFRPQNTQNGGNKGRRSGGNRQNSGQGKQMQANNGRPAKRPAAQNTATGETQAPKRTERPAAERAQGRRPERNERPDRNERTERTDRSNRDDNRNNRGSDRRGGGRDGRSDRQEGRGGQRFQRGDRPQNGRSDRNQGDRDNRYDNNRGDDRQGRKFGEKSDNRKNDRRNNTSIPAPAIEGQKPQRKNAKGKDDHKKKDYRRDDEERMPKGKKKNEPKQQLQKPQQKEQKVEEEIKQITIPEVLTIKELADKMKIVPSVIVKKLFMQGKIATVNQEIDYETAEEIALEFDVLCEKEEVVDVIEELLKEDEEDEKKMKKRPPVVCVMGHVDHGKTSLLDAIRHTNVIDREAGGITQHIGAYVVEINGEKITFLDTPGHEAFTAMRMRGASSTDIAVLVVAADDGVMPQTVEAINHAKAAGIEIVVAINKIDKPNANPDHIKEQLAQMNYLVEEWGGKYQSQDISAKKGLNLDKLLEKVLLEADMLDLKANPDRKATGTVIESTLDKGRGYVATVLVENGTLHVGDVLLSGIHTGRVKAMFNENGKKVTEAGPATPVQVLGLNGAPQAGDTFNVMDDDRSAREIASKREQLQRMQGIMTQKHVTLDEIGRRIAIGSFKELNIIVKGDVDGSVEAMAGSLIKLSKETVQVNVIHAAVGQISESDVLLAAASNAIIVGFQVRPSAAARKTAEKEEIEIRLYSIIYDAINDIKDAIEGMLEPVMKEEIVCSVEVLEIFKITKVGTVAGCIVREGKLQRSTPIRVIRDGIVIYTGKLGSLKRFKDDVKEVTTGQDCGLNIESFNDIRVGDIVEGYEQVEVKRK